MRGSSMPQISSGNSFGLGINVGWLSISHPSTPFRERAAQRCDNPRRSSTRHSSKVVPSDSKVAPALNTLLMEYGQSLLVRIGLAGCRRSKGSKRVFGGLIMFCVGVGMMGFRLVQTLVKYSSPAAPSKTIALTPLPGSRWPVRDEARHGSHQ